MHSCKIKVLNLTQRGVAAHLRSLRCLSRFHQANSNSTISRHSSSSSVRLNYSSRLYNCRPSFSLPGINIRGLSSDSANKEKEPIEAEIIEENIESSTAESAAEKDEPKSIITDNEQSHGEAEQKSFVAETQRLLQIVAESLYSDNEVFLRELISNSCDALEKRRLHSLTQRSDQEFEPLEIHVKTDDIRGQLIIQDTGIGMTRDEIVTNLGTIAHSGSTEFISKMKDSSVNVSRESIIGQFGVGFYSAFMVAKKVEVFSKSNADAADEGSYWCSSGADSYTLQQASNVQPGTKLVLHLKDSCVKFAQESVVKEIISKFASFFDKPVYLNGAKLQSNDPVWMKSQPTEDELNSLYRSVVKGGSEARFTLQYRTDVPLNMRCILFVPGEQFNMFSTLTPKDSGADVSLYSRKVLIQKRVDSKILPEWARFLKGVIDSEDIPLNLSREILQNSDLLLKMKRTLTARIIKFLLDKYKRHPESYSVFYKEYGDFIREGVLGLSNDKLDQEELMKLMLFQSSKLADGEFCNLESYVERMKAGQREIFYLCAPSRELADTSPYMETLSASGKDFEVLYALKPFDDITLSQSFEYKGNRIVSIESAKHGAAADTPEKKDDSASSDSESANEILKSHFRSALGDLIHEVKVSPVDFKSPAVIRNFDMSMSRHMLLTTLADRSEDEKLKFLHAELELNSSHPVVKKVVELKESDPETSKLLARQVLDNALVAAGLSTDSRLMMKRLDTLLARVAEKL
ncbi:heat shock protein 75 kDa, mitochondrial-like [Symsagittifera roscoffensis]|uniref:heat shock protein 75 kDa, mitochondrial-like n=1 Tax=Symsagittifera roscoffensis TaxID=84072 RepID=UPI00307C7400